MAQKINNENILFIDIETVAQAYHFNELSARKQALWTKKMNYYIQRDEQSAEELYQKAAIWAEFGKVVCISAGYLIRQDKKMFLRIKSFYSRTENELLQNFANLLNQHFNKDEHFLCAHNGKEFDFPYIARRMLVNGIKLPKLLDNAGKKPWEVNHLDTMELWKFGDHKHYTSLDLLAELFGLGSPKSEMDGSRVNQVYWQDNDLEKIATYCQSDVEALCKIYLKMNLENTDTLHVEIINA